MLSANDRSKMFACILLNFERISMIASLPSAILVIFFFYLLYHKYHVREEKGAMS